MRKSRIPKNSNFVITKRSVLDALKIIDQDQGAKDRILRMETDFRKKIKVLSDNLPVKSSKLGDLWTNPFVLMAHTYNKGYSRVSEIENDILVGKVFSFIETSVGRMVEEVVLPVYSWGVVPSEMQTPYSVIDGEYIKDNNVKFLTLKSGPRCINDSMVRGMADEFFKHHMFWAKDKGVNEIDFTVGILYGTYKKSQKKDWHILDEITREMVGTGIRALETPEDKWKCSFIHDGVTLRVDVKIGVDLWQYIGIRPETYLEVSIALVRACTKPITGVDSKTDFTILDFKQLTSTDLMDEDFNVSIIQRSQIEWLYLLVSHYCDVFVD